MGLFGKIKNIFYDIEEVEVPETQKEVEEVKKEEVKEVKINPIIEETPSERELFKSKNTFNFPIFDSEEEDIKPIIKEEVREVKYEAPKREIRRDTYIAPEPPKEQRERKVFTPTPVISPVYGILDKNYTKEEVVPKREVHEVKDSGRSYDYVRRKAYGTLEDEFENTLTDITSKKETIEDMTSDITETIDRIEESSKDIKSLLTEIEDTKVTVGDLEENFKDKIEKEEENNNEPLDNTLEHDLFNLIDSMYDSKEE